MGSFTTTTDDLIEFGILDSQTFSASRECPIFVATPDFFIAFKRNGGSEEITLPEVKSTNRIENFTAFKNGLITKQNLKVQIALQCSEINIGFLIFIQRDELEPQNCN